ncbi:hypothetical protein, variant 2 [Aphanomyces astaci]|uniref:Heparan-alpha-glucosaminide N-acetyltransferase catalytic domain-containing protein n=1 Tax=Aphanomyces astaci TaxID=112090 RepID=W4FTQ0_APHAT|nr:hypothetical protein, variant 2 [Aphanomyces astaci]ETV70890.1 hypothetical protein, variant 2 [Aphanomyces astaci]|eukprot:XP_009839552.1 hypothetical protein, variant 2 [Aphanomyces astaci]
MNKATLHFRYTSADTSSSLVMYGISDDCHRCDLVPIRPVTCAQDNATCVQLHPNTTYDFSVDGVYPMSLALRPNDEEPPVWQGSHAFMEQSEYTMQAQQLDTGDVHASIVLDTEGSPTLILTAIFVFVLLWLGSCVGLFFWKRHLASLRSDDEDDEGATSTNLAPLLPPTRPSVHTTASSIKLSATGTPTYKRIKSLDTFRGMTIFLMIFVNYGGGGYWLFNHSTWNGLTLADLVFPWFAWIMGMSMALVPPAKRTLWASGVRSVKLFALGLFINNGFDLKTWRVPGVLQSFGASYAIMSTILLGTQPTGAGPSAVPVALAMAVLVVLQLLVVYLVPVDGCPTGYVGPGGRGDHSQFVNCTGGAHRAVDVALFGAAHIFQHPTTRPVYDTPSFDPEGFLNWIMVALTTCMGYIVGTWHHPLGRSYSQKAWVLALSGLLLVVLGVALCQGRVHDGWVPVNKNLWSVSFVLMASGLGSVVFCAVYLLVDVWHMWSGAPFAYAGMNAILLYCGVSLPYKYILQYVHACLTILTMDDILHMRHRLWDTPPL